MITTNDVNENKVSITRINGKKNDIINYNMKKKMSNHRVLDASTRTTTSTTTTTHATSTKAATTRIVPLQPCTIVDFAMHLL